MIQAASKTCAEVVLAVLAIVLLLFFLISLKPGSAKIPFSDVLSILAGVPARRASWDRIVLNIRLTRSLTAILVGAALAVAGLQMQTLFQESFSGSIYPGYQFRRILRCGSCFVGNGNGWFAADEWTGTGGRPEFGHCRIDWCGISLSPDPGSWTLD